MGAVNEKLGLAESGINLSIALLMEHDLKRHGVQVLLSRYTDEDDRLKEEITECNAYNPDFALEIHTNAGAVRALRCIISWIPGSTARYRLRWLACLMPMCRST